MKLTEQYWQKQGKGRMLKLRWNYFWGIGGYELRNARYGVLSPLVRFIDRVREWNKDRVVSRLLAYELGIPVELAHALGQDATGKCYLETKKRLLAQGCKWTERPIQVTKTLEDFRQEQEEKARLNACI